MGNKSLSRAKNDKINKQMQKAKEAADKQVKILLLGAGESGKSTIFKQMRIISGHGFSEASRKEFHPKIILNVIEGCQDVLNGMDTLGIKLKSSDGPKMAKLVKKTKITKELTPDVAKAISYLWRKDAGFKEAYEQRAKFQLQDTWGEFATQLKAYPKWGGPDWIPSVEDVIRARVRTSGIVDEMFKLKKVPFRMFDVGGQRNERKKWIHCFDDVTAIIFVVAIQEYDQVLFEDANQNRLQEAVQLYKETVMNQYFANTPVILFFNKSDLFREKLCVQKVPLNASGLFPDAPETFDYDEGFAWMKQIFMEGIPAKKPVYMYDTCATDTDNINKVFSAASDIILRHNLDSSGLV